MLSGDPHKGILDRINPEEDVEKHFSEIVTLLKELVDYGTNLIIRAFDSSNRNMKDVVVLIILLKHFVAMIDAIEVLVSKGAIHAAHIQKRAAFEALIYMLWILKEEPDKKSKYYYVSNLREQRLWASRYIPNTPEQTRYFSVVGDISDLIAQRIPDGEERGQKLIAEIDNVLAQPSFLEVNQDFEQYKQAKKLPYEPSWYQPLGKGSIRQIALDVDLLKEYSVFYSEDSQIIHATSYKPHVKFSNKKEIAITPIRHLQELTSFCTSVVTITLKTYREILLHYRPSELENFSRKYINDWKDKFISLNKISVKYKSTSPIKI